MARKYDFSEGDKLKTLLWCARHCCLCGKNAGLDIEIAHIIKKSKEIDNAIPLCYECHAKIGHYNSVHPKGNKYRNKELKVRREQVYEEHTRHLIPPLHFYLNQNRNGNQVPLPFVVFHLRHLGDSLPVQITVEAKMIVGNDAPALVQSGYYNGEIKWNINPRTVFWGGFHLPQEVFDRIPNEELKIEIRMTIIDQFKREHKMLPQCWRLVTGRTPYFWNLEPRSFTDWD